MAQTHPWFATDSDVKLIVSWLQEAGAVAYGTGLLNENDYSSGKENIFHFPNIGPMEFWPKQISLSDYQ